MYVRTRSVVTVKWWWLGPALCWALLVPGLSVAATPRPNIVLILADDMGFSDIGCYGSEIHTPNLDKLAEGGVRFTQFYNTPRCCPSRAALLTGLYPQEAGVGGMMEDRGLPGYHGELNEHCVTVAEVLRGAGYHTLMVGKWHLCHISFDGKRQLNFESDTPFWDHKADWPLQRGFEEFFGTIHGVSSYFDPFSLVRDNTPVRPDTTNFYYTDAIGNQAVEFIEKYANGQTPFFLYVAFTAPHWPLQAPPADVARNLPTYLAGWDAVRAERYQRQLKLGVINQDWSLSPRDPRVPAWTKADHKTWEANRMATYAAMVEHLDAGVGKILAELQSRHIEENTLVMFLSDNGACNEVIQPEWYDVPSRTRDGRLVKVGNKDKSVYAGPIDVWQSYGTPWANVSDTPFRLYKHFTHEGGISSPFIVRWPAFIRSNGLLVQELGHITDIMPTLLDVAGAEYPKTWNSQSITPLEGKSLRPSFDGKCSPMDRPIFWEHEGNRAVRAGKWKLVSRYPGAWELYDMQADRTELHNLAASNADKVRNMSALYEQWAHRCGVVPPSELPAPIKTKPILLGEGAN